MPSILSRFQGDARSDRFNRSLEAFEISLGPYPDHAPTIRAPIKLEHQWVFISIKNGLGKTMTPQSMAVAAREVLRFGPRIITTLFEKVLEFDRKKYYHFTVPCGPGQAHLLWRGRYRFAFFGAPPLLFQNKKGLISETLLFW